MGVCARIFVWMFFIIFFIKIGNRIQTVLVKHIFDFSQTAAHILLKFALDMHLSKVSKVCSNQVCMTYFHRVMVMSFFVVI